MALSAKASEEAAHLRQTTTTTAELQQALKQAQDKAEALASELATARQDLKSQLALASKASDEAAQLKRTQQTATAELQQERERGKALANELAIARHDVETQIALSRRASDEATQLKQAVKTATAEMQQEHNRVEALTNELATVRRDAETQLVLSRKDEVAPINNNAVGAARAELRPALQQDRDRGEAAAPKPARRPSIARLAPERAANSQPDQLVVSAGEQQSTTAEIKGGLQAVRLLERATALLGQGNIGAARVVLERAAETGNAEAIFKLAETYDPLILATWSTYGTRGDAAKARDLYARAYNGGIKAAKDRSDALLRSAAGGDGRSAAKPGEIEAEQAAHR
jgi:uncharacterized phage infection (PIP) family protein YhgE